MSFKKRKKNSSPPYKLTSEPSPALPTLSRHSPSLSPLRLSYICTKLQYHTKNSAEVKKISIFKKCIWVNVSKYVRKLVFNNDSKYASSCATISESHWFQNYIGRAFAWHVGKVRNWHNSYWQHGLSFICIYVSIYISIYYLWMCISQHCLSQKSMFMWLSTWKRNTCTE